MCVLVVQFTHLSRFSQPIDGKISSITRSLSEQLFRHRLQINLMSWSFWDFGALLCPVASFLAGLDQNRNTNCRWQLIRLQNSESFALRIFSRHFLSINYSCTVLCGTPSVLYCSRSLVYRRCRTVSRLLHFPEWHCVLSSKAVSNSSVTCLTIFST